MSASSCPSSIPHALLGHRWRQRGRPRLVKALVARGASRPQPTARPVPRRTASGSAWYGQPRDRGLPRLHGSSSRAQEWPSTSRVVATPVQGPTAPAAVTGGVGHARWRSDGTLRSDRSVVRGGGSKADLAAFDTEIGGPGHCQRRRSRYGRGSGTPETSRWRISWPTAPSSPRRSVVAGAGRTAGRRLLGVGRRAGMAWWPDLIGLVPSAKRRAGRPRPVCSEPAGHGRPEPSAPVTPTGCIAQARRPGGTAVAPPLDVRSPIGDGATG